MSLPVPRQIAPGVIWDEAAEASFLNLRELLIERGNDEVFAEREARWTTELVLHRRLVADQVRAAMACATPADKRALYGWWVKKLGQAQAERLAVFAKDEKMRARVIGWK